MEQNILSLRKHYSDIAPIPNKVVSPCPVKQKISLSSSILSEIMDGAEGQQNDLPNRAFSADACIFRCTPSKGISSGTSSSNRSSLTTSPKNPFFREVIGEDVDENIDCEIPTRSANPIIYNEAFFGSSNTVAN